MTTKQLTVEDVELWYIERGIGHVIDWAGNGMTHTLCDVLVMGANQNKKRPSRVCRTCRERIAKATRNNQV